MCETMPVRVFLRQKVSKVIAKRTKIDYHNMLFSINIKQMFENHYNEQKIPFTSPETK